MEIVGLTVAVLASLVAWLSWRAARHANQISAESTEIARRALSISEEEHALRELERRTRARLSVTVEPAPNHEMSDDGAIWTTAGTLITSLEITIVNRGERATGKTLVDVWIPRMPGSEAFWAETAGGRELPDLARSTPDPRVRLNLGGGAPLYDSARLSRTLDRVAVDLPERVYLRAPFLVQSDEHAYPVDVVVRAEGADDVRRAPWCESNGDRPQPHD